MSPDLIPASASRVILAASNFTGDSPPISNVVPSTARARTVAILLISSFTAASIPNRILSTDALVRFPAESSISTLMEFVLKVKSDMLTLSPVSTVIGDLRAMAPVEALRPG